MALDSSIALGVKPIQVDAPVNQFANILQLQGAQQANQLNAMKMAQAQQVNERQNQLLKLTGGWGADTTDDQRISGLKNAGYFDEADKLATALQNRRKIDSEAAVKDAEAVEKRLQFSRSVLDMVQTPEQFMAWHQGNHSDPILGKLLEARGITADSALANINAALQQPGGLEKLKAQSALGMEKFIEQNKPTLTTQNLGGTSQIVATPALGFDPSKVVRSDTITQSADNKATNETSRANNQATVGATIRGQNLTDAREAKKMAQADSHFQATQAGGKPLTEGQANSARYGSRMAESHDILQELSGKGVNVSNPGSRSGWGVGDAVNMISSADQQRLDQAKRDFINANLRRESGASISPTEFDNAEKQYFPQRGDSKEVIAQKAKNREIAIRGMQAEIPENQRGKVISEIRGGGQSGGASGGWGAQPSTGGFKYIGTEK